MKKLLAATTMIMVCSFPYPNVSRLPLLANVIDSRCELEAIRQTEVDIATLTNIYVSEAKGSVLEVCVDANDAVVSISEQGDMTLIQRDPAFDIDYYTSGSRDGRIRKNGVISFDYYTNGSRKGKIQRIGGLIFNYYTRGDKAGKLRQIGNIRFDYYTSGFREGRLQSIGRASFDYDREGRMETTGSLSNVNITIVDFVDLADSNQ